MINVNNNPMDCLDPLLIILKRLSLLRKGVYQKVVSRFLGHLETLCLRLTFPRDRKESFSVGASSFIPPAISRLLSV